MGRIDIDQAPGAGMLPMPAIAAAREHKRTDLAVFNDTEPEVAIVRSGRYGMPIVQGQVLRLVRG